MQFLWVKIYFTLKEFVKYKFADMGIQTKVKLALVDDPEIAIAHILAMFLKF